MESVDGNGLRKPTFVIWHFPRGKSNTNLISQISIHTLFYIKKQSGHKRSFIAYGPVYSYPGDRWLYMSKCFLVGNIFCHQILNYIMKKILSVLSFCVLSASVFATNSWNKPFGKSAFDDPYVNNYNVSEVGTFGYPNHAVLVQADFNTSVPVPYYVVIQVAGVWAGIGNGYKQFTLLYGTGTWHKSINYPLVGTEQVYPEVYDLVDYGPQ